MSLVPYAVSYTHLDVYKRQATGSEASNTTVVTNSENGHMKRALSHECLRPDFARCV